MKSNLEKNGDESLNDTLLGADRSRWPAVWRRLLIVSDRESLSSVEDDRIFSALTDAVQAETKLSIRNQPAVHLLQSVRATLAAPGPYILSATIVACLLIAFLVHRQITSIGTEIDRQPYVTGIKLEKISRGATILRHGEKVTYKPGMILLHGDTINLQRSSQEALLAGIGKVHRINGPARMTIEAMGSGDQRKVVLSLNSGEISVYGTAKYPVVRLFWRTPGAEFEIVGTTARLKVRNGGAEIQVLHGTVIVRVGRLPDQTLSSNYYILLDDSSTTQGARNDRGQLQPRVLTKGMRKKLIVLERILSSYANGSPADHIAGSSPSRYSGNKFLHEEAIRLRYGSLQNVILKNGVSFKGYYYTRNGLFYVHTMKGIIVLQRNQIDQVIEL